MFALDYLREIVPEEAISKLPWPYPVLFSIIVGVLALLIALNTKPIRERIESHHEKLNRLLIIIFIILVPTFRSLHL